MQPTVAVAHAGRSQVPEPDTERRLVLGLALVVVSRAVLPHKAAGPADTDPKAGDQKLDEVPFLDRPQSFFVMTS